MAALDLRELRLRLGMSQRELAELLGVKQNNVSEWERGKRRIPPRHAERLSELGAQPAEETLRTDAEPPPDEPPEPRPAATPALLDLEARIALLYQWTAQGVVLFDHRNEQLQRASRVVQAHSQQAARAWVHWGETNPRVRRFWETITGPGAAGEVIVVHAMMLMGIWQIYATVPATPTPGDIPPHAAPTPGDQPSQPAPSGDRSSPTGSPPSLSIVPLAPATPRPGPSQPE